MRGRTEDGKKDKGLILHFPGSMNESDIVRMEDRRWRGRNIGSEGREVKEVKL